MRDDVMYYLCDGSEAVAFYFFYFTKLGRENE